MRKDIAYLMAKGYVELSGFKKNIKINDVKEDAIIVVKLTADGLDIAQDLKDDPALEI